MTTTIESSVQYAVYYYMVLSLNSTVYLQLSFTSHLVYDTSLVRVFDLTLASSTIFPIFNVSQERSTESSYYS